MKKIKRDNLEEATILNFISLVVSINNLIAQPDEELFEWKTPGYNFYLKRYKIVSTDKSLQVIWENLNGEFRYVLLRKKRFNNSILQKLYSMFYTPFETNDIQRYSVVLTQVVYPDFVKDYDVKLDFSKAESNHEAADMVMCSLYWNYFSAISVDEFVKIFNLRNVLSDTSIEYIKNYA